MTSTILCSRSVRWLFSAHLVKEKKHILQAAANEINVSASLVGVLVSHSVMIRTFFKSFAIRFVTEALMMSLWSRIQSKLLN